MRALAADVRQQAGIADRGAQTLHQRGFVQRDAAELAIERVRQRWRAHGQGVHETISRRDMAFNMQFRGAGFNAGHAGGGNPYPEQILAPGWRRARSRHCRYRVWAYTFSTPYTYLLTCLATKVEQ